MNALPPLPPEIQAALARGETLKAIKLLRTHQGLDLKTAKARVDAYRAADPRLGPAPPTTTVGPAFWLIMAALLLAAWLWLER